MGQVASTLVRHTLNACPLMQNRVGELVNVHVLGLYVYGSLFLESRRDKRKTDTFAKPPNVRGTEMD